MDQRKFTEIFKEAFRDSASRGRMQAAETVSEQCYRDLGGERMSEDEARTVAWAAWNGYARGHSDGQSAVAHRTYGVEKEAFEPDVKGFSDRKSFMRGY